VLPDLAGYTVLLSSNNFAAASDSGLNTFPMPKTGNACSCSCGAPDVYRAADGGTLQATPALTR